MNVEQKLSDINSRRISIYDGNTSVIQIEKLARTVQRENSLLTTFISRQIILFPFNMIGKQEAFQ